jgi:hypothetical protein
MGELRDLGPPRPDVDAHGGGVLHRPRRRGVAGAPDHGVNPWWFLALDVGTSPTYGLGQAMGVKLMRDERRPMRDAMPWIAMLFVSFVAPYAYLLTSAGKLPGYVMAGHRRCGWWCSVAWRRTA